MIMVINNKITDTKNQHKKSSRSCFFENFTNNNRKYFDWKTSVFALNVHCPAQEGSVVTKIPPRTSLVSIYRALLLSLRCLHRA